MALRYNGSVIAPFEHCPQPAIGSAGPGQVRLRMLFAAMNYRDSLAAASPSSSSLPGRILGNEGVGVVEQSHNPAFSAGDVVFANGAGLGSERDGTLASHALVPEASLMPLPEGLEPASAAILGAAGMVAMLSLQAMERANAGPTSGPFAVTGASGGVGRTTVALLAAAGLEVTAITRRLENSADLKALGAARIMALPAAEITQSQAFMAEEWAGAVDVVGGDPLNWLLRTAKPGACICAAGIVSGFTLSTNLAALILRNVTLAGITARVARETRLAAFSRLAKLAGSVDVERLGRFIPMELAAEALLDIRHGRAAGRVVVRFP